MRTCSVSELRDGLAGGRFRVIDVREAPEFDAEHIEGARLLPLSTLTLTQAKSLAARPGSDESEYVVVCRSGGRASQAASKLAAWGVCEPRVLQGGLNAWTLAGHPTVKGTAQVWALERQVRLAAGVLVLAGVLLGFVAHPGFFWLSGFVGAGLVFAALTNTCGMAMLLARMPWNRASAPASCRRNSS